MRSSRFKAVVGVLLLVLILSACTDWGANDAPGFTEIGPEGGLVRSVDGKAILDVPPQALKAPTGIRIIATDTPIPTEFGRQEGVVYRIEPRDLYLEVPADLIFPELSASAAQELHPSAISDLRFIQYIRNAWQGIFGRYTESGPVLPIRQGGEVGIVEPGPQSRPIVRWPMEDGQRISQAFAAYQGNWVGTAADNAYKYKHHTGIDISNNDRAQKTPDHQPVRAFADGTVYDICDISIAAGCDFGNTVVLKHTTLGGMGNKIGTVYTLYGHLNDFMLGETPAEGTLTKGMPVFAGQQIGHEGHTGLMSPDHEHLHFELRNFPEPCYRERSERRTIPGGEGIIEKACGYSVPHPEIDGPNAGNSYLDPLQYLYPVTPPRFHLGLGRVTAEGEKAGLTLRASPASLRFSSSATGELNSQQLMAGDTLKIVGHYYPTADSTCSSWALVEPYPGLSIPLSYVPRQWPINANGPPTEWPLSEYFTVPNATGSPYSSVPQAWVCDRGPSAHGRPTSEYLSSDPGMCVEPTEGLFGAAGTCSDPGSAGGPLSGTFYAFYGPGSAEYLDGSSTSYLPGWRDELDDLVEIGMDTVVIQFATFRDGNTRVTTAWHEDSLFTDLLVAAHERDMQVFLGLGYDDAWGVGYDPTLEVLPLIPSAREQTALVDAIHTNLRNRLTAQGRLQALSALAGFYIPQEISNTPTIIGYDQEEPWVQPMFPMIDYLRTITNHVHSTTGLRVLVAPYFGIASTPERYAAWWDSVLAQVNIDIIALQDGVGTERFCDITEALPYFQALQPIALKHGVDFWSDLETFNAIDVYDWKAIPSDFARVHRQFALTAPHVSKLITFSYRADMSPKTGGAATNLYKAYQRYLASPTDPPGPLTRCNVTRIDVGAPELTIPQGQYASHYVSPGVIRYTYEVIGGAEASRSLTFTSDNSRVASVDTFGSITAREPGTATITLRSYTHPSVSATMRVTVPEPQVVSVQITGIENPYGDITCDAAFTECTMRAATVGESLYFGLLTETVDDKGNVVWGRRHFTTTNPHVAECSTDVDDPNELGYCTVVARGNGSTTITVYSSQNPSIHDSIHVTVQGR